MPLLTNASQLMHTGTRCAAPCWEPARSRPPSRAILKLGRGSADSSSTGDGQWRPRVAAACSRCLLRSAVPKKWKLEVGGVALSYHLGDDVLLASPTSSSHPTFFFLSLFFFFYHLFFHFSKLTRGSRGELLDSDPKTMIANESAM